MERHRNIGHYRTYNRESLAEIIGVNDILIEERPSHESVGAGDSARQHMHPADFHPIVVNGVDDRETRQIGQDGDILSFVYIYLTFVKLHYGALAGGIGYTPVQCRHSSAVKSGASDGKVTVAQHLYHLVSGSVHVKQPSGE